MDAKPEEFKNLRRLLALKRHEQPPPGYFHEFSRDVIVRIESGEADRETFAERLSAEAPWLGNLVELFSGKPLWSGAVGAAACALIIGGVVWIGNQDVKTVDAAALLQPAFSLPPEQASFVFNDPLAQPQPISLTNTSDQPNIPGSLFNGPSIDPLRVKQLPGPLLQR